MAALAESRIVGRRALLKTAGLALAGFGLPARRTATSVGAAVPRRPSVRLAVPAISWARVIRTTVGLRPHRDGGFVLRAQKLDAKTLIHDYGHGGTGMSIGWGCGVLVSELASQTGERRAAVIGCGSPGLTAALQLQRRGFDVTIYAKTVPPDTTSNMSLAGFTPTTALINKDKRTAEWNERFTRITELSYRQLQLMVGPKYGVYWMDTYNGSDTPDPPQGGGRGGDAAAATESELLPEYLRPGHARELLGPGEHPFPTKYAFHSVALSIEPNRYLDALVRDFQSAGGRIVIRAFDTPRDLMSLAEPVVVNCTGLGSYSLFDDKELVPIKGQLTALVPQAEVNYRASGRLPDTRNAVAPVGGQSIAATINPRSDGIIVGNLQDRGNWSLEPDEDVRQRNMAAAIAYFSAMRLS